MVTHYRTALFSSACPMKPPNMYPHESSITTTLPRVNRRQAGRQAGMQADTEEESERILRGDKAEANGRRKG